MSAFVGAIAIADLVKTTLGPKGMDKILQSVRAAAGGGSARGPRGTCVEYQTQSVSVVPQLRRNFNVYRA